MAKAAALLEYVETETDLDVIAITDHDDIRGAWAAREIWARGRHRFDLVVGAEITTIEGHLLALYLQEPVQSLRPVDEVLAAVHRQGGLCIVPHPMSPLTRSLDRKTIERVCGSAKEGVYFDGIEAAHRSPILGRWRRTGSSLNRDLSLSLAELASSDSHFLTTVGSGHTAFPGRTGEELKTAVLHRTTRAITGHCPTLLDIGIGPVLSQAVRGLTATPRIMGWGPTAASFVRRILHRG
jgi:predicted metal-dependent phosphoesterase TrpH